MIPRVSECTDNHPFYETVGALLAPPRVRIPKPLQVVQVMWFTVSFSDGAALVASALLSVLILPLSARLVLRGTPAGPSP